MYWTLHVKNYGKIAKADVQVKPLTLFVGDNNSGKSYLLYLIWALQHRSTFPLLLNGVEKINNDELIVLKKDVETFLAGSTEATEFVIQASGYGSIINSLLERNKQRILKNLFNYDGIKLESISVTLPDEPLKVLCQVTFDNDSNRILVKYDDERVLSVTKTASDKLADKVVLAILKCLTIKIFGMTVSDGTFYFPAARTGFVLSRDVINKYGRMNSFDSVMEGEELASQKFTKPVLQFLDMLELYDEGEKDNQDILTWIEKNISRGHYEYINEQSKELVFIPEGAQDKDVRLPMRASSAVVTEISPLYVLLKNNSYFRTICYEEPEMCLHPQLQLQMAKCLVRLVNKGVGIVATTHSDIIVQHISNMCVLYSRDDKAKILQDFDYDSQDMLDVNKVAIYQFTSRKDGTEVVEITHDDGAFDIPTFGKALTEILQVTMDINDR